MNSESREMRSQFPKVNFNLWTSESSPQHALNVILNV